VRHMAARMRSALLGFGLVAIVAGCAKSPATAGPPTPRPTQIASPVAIPACAAIAIPSATAPPHRVITPPADASTITVTSADDRATVFMTTGQHLVVKVGFPGPPVWSGTPQGADIYWDVPQAPYPGPLYRDGSVRCPGGSALAIFTAVGTGGTTVDATTDAPCLHTHPSCEIPQQGIEIYVVVR
jgi:hypothetical protein